MNEKMGKKQKKMNQLINMNTPLTIILKYRSTYIHSCDTIVTDGSMYYAILPYGT